MGLVVALPIFILWRCLIEIRTKIEYKRPLYKNSSKYSNDVLKFFTSRKISEKTLLKFKISEGVEWMPKNNAQINTIQFNYFRNGELINVKYRGKNKFNKSVFK
jgi:twinkle protein